MCLKVLFVDVDGPMIPMRAAYLPDQTKLYSIFDPCAASMLLQLLKESKAKIVVSSSWRIHGRSRCAALFEKNGIDSSHFHEDWSTPIRREFLTRSQEIHAWLRVHPEITHYAAIDDEILDRGVLFNVVQCCTYEGFSWLNYMQCCELLGIGSEFDRRVINFLKSKLVSCDE